MFCKIFDLVLSMPKVKTSKEEIVFKALGTFRKNGYFNTSMHDLAINCGLQKGSFYHYFTSKEDLMIEVLNSIRKLLNNEIFIIAYDETAPPKKRMESMLIKLGNVLLKKEGGCIVGNSILEISSHSLVFKNVLKEILADWILALKCIFQNLYSELESQKMAEQTIMEFEGAVMLGLLYDNEQFVKDVFFRTLAKL